jgi:hypothetical protein
MNKKYLKAMITPFTATILLLSVFLSSISPVSAQPAIARENIMWGAGFWAGLTSFNPLFDNSGTAQGWGTHLMYEPLFGTDVASGAIIDWLGQSIGWVNSTTIKIMLRSGCRWSIIKDWAGWTAGTYTPEDNGSITADDVLYSWWLSGAYPDSPSAATGMSALHTSPRVTSFEKVNATEILVHLNSTYANSNVVWRTLTNGYLIVPKAVWKPIYTALGAGYLAFANDWTNSSYPYPRVASGMYLPWYISGDKKQIILKKNDNWWGISALGKQPAPQYMGYYVGYSNTEIENMMMAGLIDWDGSYVPGYPWYPAPLHTYFASSPYFADKSALLLTPNYRKWPICESWLHWAIADVMGYSANSAAASGYCVNGSKYVQPSTTYYSSFTSQYPNAFLIPKDDAVANALLAGYPNKNKYLVGNQFNTVKEALGNLTANCYYIYNGAIDSINTTTGYPTHWGSGAWYTKGDNTTEIKAWIANMYDYLQAHPECNWFNADPPIVIGTVSHKASEWLANWNSYLPTADQLSGIPGINVKLGYSDYPYVGSPWTIIDIDGWTDTIAIDIATAATVTSVLGIPTISRVISWDAYQGWSTGEGQTYVYDFMDYVMHLGINSNLYERYAQLFTCWSGVWNHYNGWYNTTLIDLINSLDTASNPQTVANKIFDIVGTYLPYIPGSGHPDWYIYSTKYWTGWPNATSPFLPDSPYGGPAQNVNLLQLLLGLKAVAVTVAPAAGIPAGYIVAVGIIVVVVIVVLGYAWYRRRPPKK